MDLSALLVFRSEQGGVRDFEKTAAMQHDPRTLARGAHQPPERLVHLGHARDLVDATKGSVARQSGERGLSETAALHGVHFRKSGADDHCMRHATAQDIDAFREAGTEDKK